MSDKNPKVFIKPFWIYIRQDSIHQITSHDTAHICHHLDYLTLPAATFPLSIKNYCPEQCISLLLKSCSDSFGCFGLWLMQTPGPSILNFRFWISIRILLRCYVVSQTYFLHTFPFPILLIWSLILTSTLQLTNISQSLLIQLTWLNDNILK